MNTRGHRFGGPWTEQKLECVSKYLHSYTQIIESPRTKTPLLTLGM